LTSTGADLRQVIYALSEALDLVGVDDVAHGKRVAIMAAECAKAGGMSPAEISMLFDLGMLHDIGVSSTSIHQSLVREFDWESSQQHCLAGADLLKDFAPLARLAEPIRYHHTHWEQLVKCGIGKTVAEAANLVFLVDRVDALAASHYADGTLFSNTERIRGQIRERAGTYFAPHLVDLFLAASASEVFWLLLETRSIQTYLQEMLARDEPYAATIPELRQLAIIFSRIVDAKSHFTAEHSLGVAALARHIAQKMGISADNCDRIEIAGLLHDIGKLRVPDEVLEKPGRLDDRERLIMNTHSFETFQILRRISGFERIAVWAAYHHEEPDGSGYPFHVRSETLDPEARIMRVADIIQALAQNRPYRQSLPTEKVRELLLDLMAKGRVDAEITRVALEDLPAAIAAATNK